MLFWLPYFSPKSFDFFSIRLLVCFCVMPSQLLIEFSFVVSECPVLSVLFSLCRYLFNLPSFAKTFWFISSSCIAISRVAFSFLFPRIPASFFCFIILSCFRWFFYLRFQSNFPSWFWPFCFLRESQFSHKLISPLHRLVHLTQLYYLLIYKVVFQLFYSFLF